MGDAQRPVSVGKMVAVDPGDSGNAVASSHKSARKAGGDSRPAGRVREHVVKGIGRGQGADRALKREAGVGVGDVHCRAGRD